MIGDVRLRTRLAEAWGLTGATVEVHNGGINSATWFVADRGERWVAKAVAPGARRSFAGGLTVATALDAAGIPAGAPVPARDGDLVVDVDGIPLALLTWVDGEEADDRRLIGTTLGRVHRTLRDVPMPDAERFHWVDPRADHLGLRPWVRPAVSAAVEAYDRLGPETLTWGLLHTDPNPDAFRVDRARGVCGVIDWSVAMTGPLLYDLASAVMYAGGPEHARDLIESYHAERVVPRAEVDRALGTMLRFRWAVQADYFARRIAGDDLTGGADNERGLADAGAWFSAFGR
ncbi:phosphotransferase enzyme family protein [Catenuloplanes atrovinosus]|uniref:Homoserine kinase type II n=1 Tax=Catenuloplanes atrovinosus TaxID=137266 RepID=A0AAE4C9V9_9ACTN|nr:phosphotransferase [Catenuloplanes atrovinosus]MDR7276237.1 homoserine kinase type II [Catenuloplanes atrovinosus]